MPTSLTRDTGRLMLFLQSVLIDLGTWCDICTTRDYQTIAGRVEHEGISFLTITLPSFGKDFERSLALGEAAPGLFSGFQRRGGLPRFLGGFLELVFDRESGRLLPEPSVEAIRAVRQLTLMFAKIKLPCTPARERAAMRQYWECEQDVRETIKAIDPVDLDQFARIGSLLWAGVLTDVDLEIHRGNIVPKHGPGATADKLRGNAKWNQREWPERLDRVFPSGENLVPSWRHYQSLSDVQYLEPGAERPVKVISVPKTLKTPRIIAVEPTCMQYMQQGLLEAICRAVNSDKRVGRLIGWASAVPNQHLARLGSRNGDLATLDLSEASDRVSNQHVQLLLRNHSLLAEAVDSCRSRKADVPGHGLIDLAKFASMGSALTFPLEAMVFMTIVFCAVEKELNHRLTQRDVDTLLGKVRCYGDDIIVPVSLVDTTIQLLERHGLKVNKHKSFWTGKFRESCGKEYYDGADVTLARVRTLLPGSRLHVSEIESTAALRNHLYWRGLWKAAAHLDDLMARLIPWPVVAETSPILGRHSALGYETQRICPKLHRPLIKGWKARRLLPVSKLEDEGALMKVLISMHRRSQSSQEHGDDQILMMLRGDEPVADDQHLVRAGRARSATPKTGWGPSF